MRTWMFAALVAFGLVSQAQALPMRQQLCDGFLPKNEMRIPDGLRTRTGITESQFNAVLDRINGLYKKEIAARGAKFVISRNWKEAEVNAYADRSGTTWAIFMFGGLARHRAMTSDGFALVACHEVGHHLGGAPKYGSSDSPEWAANEGQSDYYATLKCMRRYFEKDDNEKILAKMKLDSVAKATCEREHRNRADQRLCIRGAMAGLSLATLFEDLSQDGPIHFNTPDRHVVDSTQDAHPASQCRLDTYFHGALCTTRVSEAVSETDYRPGTCWDSTQEESQRPRCWFHP